jgi:hypothetical protein
LQLDSERPRFQSWLRGDSNLLWIRGGPGKGKTMMSVYLTEAIASEKCRSLAYYFCIGQEMKQNNASAVLRGILWQITEHHPDLMQHVLPYFDPSERGSATISSEETLWILLAEICPMPRRKGCSVSLTGLTSATRNLCTGSSTNSRVLNMILHSRT